MPSSPITENTNLPSFSILSSGSEIPDTYQVLSIRILNHVNRIAEAEIILRDGNPATETFDVSDSETFIPGKEIEIKLGYHNKNKSAFKGLVVKQNLVIDGHSDPKLHVICRDKALKMTVNRQNAIFSKKKDSDIFSTLIGNSSLSANVDSTTAEHEQVVQYYTSDWDFLMNRAEINGMLVTTNSGTVAVQKPSVDGTPELEVTYGMDVIEFDGELDATHQYSGASGSSWDYSSQEVISKTGTSPSTNEQGNIDSSTLAKVLSAGEKDLISSGTITQDDLQGWANATLVKSSLSRFKGTVKFQGSTNALPNTLIKLNGFGKRFNGNAFIGGVVQSLENGNWTTEVKIGISSNWFVESHQVNAPEASGLIPGVKGLQTGKVKKTYEDPDNEFRVQVEIPILGAENETVWARLSTFYASNSFGAYFMPEVDDEVILGFMNEDPRYPIILGSVYSSKLPPSETPDEKNTIKTIVTQSKMQLKFDDENKVITVLTPGGNTMVFSDQDKAITVTDENNNKIEMNDSGISLTSPSKINIKADSDVTISGANVTIKGDQDFSASASQVSVSGDMSTSITGNSECSISSSGNLTAKGAMVMIN